MFYCKYNSNIEVQSGPNIDAAPDTISKSPAIGRYVDENELCGTECKIANDTVIDSVRKGSVKPASPLARVSCTVSTGRIPLEQSQGDKPLARSSGRALSEVSFKQDADILIPNGTSDVKNQSRPSLIARNATDKMIQNSTIDDYDKYRSPIVSRANSDKIYRTVQELARSNNYSKETIQNTYKK
jgi:hypothetical protein